MPNCSDRAELDVAVTLPPAAVSIAVFGRSKYTEFSRLNASALNSSDFDPFTLNRLNSEKSTFHWWSPRRTPRSVSP